jgi:hypothetical protein
LHFIIQPCWVFRYGVWPIADVFGGGVSSYLVSLQASSEPLQLLVYKINILKDLWIRKKGRNVFIYSEFTLTKWSVVLDWSVGTNINILHTGETFLAYVFLNIKLYCIPQMFNELLLNACNYHIYPNYRCTNFSNLFWNETLHVSDNSSVHHQELFTVHIAMVYVIQVCWQLLVMDSGTVQNM